ncbi:MAG TPA: penicillin-binding protein 2 [Egibacteraceae bacterium]|nr:penicillin-binding protein 2 [Egibacteraceae bacterium]
MSGQSTLTRARPRPAAPSGASRRGGPPPRWPPPSWGPAAAEWYGRLSAALRRSRSRRRLTVMLAGYLVLTLLMSWRLVSIQVLQSEEYQSLAARQTHRDIELPARRGRLYARDGEPLAMSLEAATVYANPRVYERNGIDPSFIAATLAPLVDRPLLDVMRALTKDTSFSFVARQLPREVGEQIEALKLPGIQLLSEPRRVYPSDGLAAQTIGFAGVDNQGLAGLEAQYESVLAGKPGRMWLERAPRGLTIDHGSREVEPSVAGTDLVLTLDREIQHATERALADAVAEHGAVGGSAVVVDAESGEVLAMASAPTYDPARIDGSDEYARRNRVVTDVFEPGSVNKVITAAAALEAGLVRPDEVFTVPDTFPVAGKRFKDSSPHETKPMTFAQIMEESSNVGTIQVALRLGEERMYRALRAFGYGERTGLGFPGESAGLLWPTEDWSGTSLPTISIGQGVSATLLQVAQVFGVIANGGEWVEPLLVRGEVGPDGMLRQGETPKRRRVVSRETATQIAAMLSAVVEGERGTGTRAAVPGYRVAGKTGTAQKASTTRRGYEDGAYIASFAGFAPADNPRLVAAVMLDEPDTIYGGVAAAPVFSEIMSFALGHRRIPPSDAAAAARAAEPARAAAPPAAAGDDDG